MPAVAAGGRGVPGPQERREAKGRARDVNQYADKVQRLNAALKVANALYAGGKNAKDACAEAAQRFGAPRTDLMVLFTASKPERPKKAPSFCACGRRKAHRSKQCQECMNMGKASRDKGKRGERQLAHAIKAVFPELDVRRGAGQSRRGDDCADVVGLPGFWIESKCGKTPNPRAALAQAIEASAKTQDMPVAVIRDDRKEPFAVMRLSDFLELAKARVQKGGV